MTAAGKEQRRWDGMEDDEGINPGTFIHNSRTQMTMCGLPWGRERVREGKGRKVGTTVTAQTIIKNKIKIDF